MKKISNKKGFFIFLYIFSFSLIFSASQNEKKEILPVSKHKSWGYIYFALGPLFGQGNELVFYKNDYLSKLTWPLFPAMSYSLGGNFHLPIGFYIDTKVKLIQKGKSGRMTDSDYMNTPWSTKKTHFSAHTSYLSTSVIAGITVGYSIPVYPRKTSKKRNITIAIEPNIGFRYSDITWTAYDGYLQYPAQNAPPYDFWDPSKPKAYLTGKGLKYKQTTTIPVIGVNLNMQFPRSISIDVGIQASPFLIAEAHDYHYLRSLHFIDTFRTGIAFYSDITALWQFSSYWGLYYSLEYTALKSHTGSEKAGIIGSRTFNNNQARVGIELYHTSFSLGFSVSLFK